MMITCCKNCDERYPACHDSCQRYIKEKTENLEARLKQKRQCQIDSDISNMRRSKRGKR